MTWRHPAFIFGGHFLEKMAIRFVISLAEDASNHEHYAFLFVILSSAYYGTEFVLNGELLVLRMTSFFFVSVQKANTAHTLCMSVVPNNAGGFPET